MIARNAPILVMDSMHSNQYQWFDSKKKYLQFLLVFMMDRFTEFWVDIIAKKVPFGKFKQQCIFRWLSCQDMQVSCQES